jgi:simple sugar transport system substrate-binding protein
MTGCLEPGGRRDATPQGSDPTELTRIVLVTHGQSADPFWSVVARGAREAGSKLGVRVEYQAPGTFNMVEMSQLVDAVVASRPAGLAISIPDGDALAASVRSAVSAGIPVLSINSGDGVYGTLGLRTHVGQPEREAGIAAGLRLAEAGVTRALCVNHEVGNVALDARCDGLEEGLRQTGGTTTVLAVDLADPEDAQQRIAGAIAREIQLGTFDLSTSVLEAIQDGRMAFAIDQRPYLQGYLAVVLLEMSMRLGGAPEGVIRTGPSFVTAENAADVSHLVQQGLR